MEKRFISFAHDKGREEGNEKGHKKGRKKGHKEGRKDTSIKHAKMMLDKGLDDEIIKDITGLTQTELDALKP